MVTVDSSCRSTYTGTSIDSYIFEGTFTLDGNRVKTGKNGTWTILMKNLKVR